MELTEVIIGDGSAVLFKTKCQEQCLDARDLVSRTDEVSVGVAKALGKASCDRCTGPIDTIFDGQAGCGITTPYWMRK